MPDPDRGLGGKYLFLPPGHAGDVPDGYFVFQSPTHSNWVVIRALDGLEALLTTRIYPLATADSPPDTGFVDMAEASFNGIHANDFTFFEEVDQIVQEEPEGALDPERAGQLAALGIVRGRPFKPDARLRAILEQAARIGAGIARTLLYKPRDPDVYIFEGASWKTAFVGGSYEFLAHGARMLDYRALMHYVGTGITPAMTHAAPGIGSQYAYTVDDANGETLDGAKTYTLTLRAPIPVKTFWAIDIYDTQTRSLLQTDNPYPSINDRFSDLHTEANGDVVIHFGPQPPTDTGDQLAPHHPRQELVPHPPALRPARSLVRPDLATWRAPTGIRRPAPATGSDACLDSRRATLLSGDVRRRQRSLPTGPASSSHRDDPTGLRARWPDGYWSVLYSAGKSAPHLCDVCGQAFREGPRVERRDRLSLSDGLTEQLPNELRDREAAFVGQIAQPRCEFLGEPDRQMPITRGCRLGSEVDALSGLVLEPLDRLGLGHQSPPLLRSSAWVIVTAMSTACARLASSGSVPSMRDLKSRKMRSRSRRVSATPSSGNHSRPSAIGVPP